MRPYIKILQLVVFLVLLHAVYMGIYFYNMPHRDIAGSRPDYIITADAFEKEFSVNEASANEKYTGKTVELTGKIAETAIREGKVITIILKTSNQNSSVICNLAMPVDPAELNNNSEIKVRGEVSGYLMDVLLNNCIVIRNSGKDKVAN